MTKRELQAIWRKLDRACEAIEQLEYDKEGLELLEKRENLLDVTAIVSLKNDVEELIEKRTRK